MESMRIKVPKTLIKEFHEHPEPYGDFVVVLKNDMYTDIFKDDDGHWYTITNDQALIDYLEKQTEASEHACQYCGSPLLDGALFCALCGQKVDGDDEDRQINSKKRNVYARRLAIYSMGFGLIYLIGSFGVDKEAFEQSTYILIVSMSLCFLMCGLLVLVFIKKVISIKIPIYILTFIYGIFELVGFITVFTNVVYFLIIQAMLFAPGYFLMQYYKLK